MLLQKWEAKIRQKEKSPHLGIKLTTTRSWIGHAHHWATPAGPKLKEFTDDNLNFDENDRNFSEWVENTVGKGEIARNEQFLLFPYSFQKTCTADT